MISCVTGTRGWLSGEGETGSAFRGADPRTLIEQGENFQYENYRRGFYAAMGDVGIRCSGDD